ncbi:MAG: hypothetical protein C0608_09610 [Deltaproteobacteria bacterium]|nr:MAG: hypothetical protein C0608_09610 [Deltaproteobacteria bacterium]
MKACTGKECFLKAPSTLAPAAEERCEFTLKMLRGLDAAPDARSNSGDTALTMAVLQRILDRISM